MGSSDKVNRTYLRDNQIMFRESGIVINKAVFVHVKFALEMGPVLDAIEEIGQKLESVHKTELKNANLDILPYLMGSEGNNSVWRQNEAAELWRKRSMDGVAISGMLYKMFNGTVNQLASALEIIPDKYTVNSGFRFHERQKRFAGIGAFVWAGYNHQKIDNLEKHFANLTSKYNSLVDYVQELSGRHIQLSVDVALLKDLVILLNKKNYHKIMTLVMTLENQLKETVDDVKAITREGNRGRIAAELLGGKDVVSVFDILKKEAVKRGCQMIMDSPADIYEMDATYGYDSTRRTFVAYLHVPMYETGEELKLWEYVPFPILQSITLNATIVPQTGKENYIALMPDSSIKGDGRTPSHKFRIMNGYDLEMCKRIRNVYMCGGRNTLRTDISNSCIGNLHLQDHEGIARTCDLEIGRLTEFVAKIGYNKWAVFSPKPFMENVRCGETTESIKFEIQTIVELPEDCKVNLKSTQLTTDVNINIEYKIERFEWKYDGNIFHELEIEDKDLAVLIQEMIATKSKFGLKDLSHLKHYFEYTENGLIRMFNRFSEMFNFLFMLDDIIIIAGVIVIVILILVVMSRFGLLERAWTLVCGSKNTTENMAMNLQVREAIMGNAEIQNLIRLARRNLGNDPPPYHSVEMVEPSAPRIQGVIRRADSTLSVDSRFEPSELRGEEMTDRVAQDCNPGPVMERGIRRNSFVCTQHPEDRIHLCAGYYSLPREGGPRNVRFQNENIV